MEREVKRVQAENLQRSESRRMKIVVLCTRDEVAIYFYQMAKIHDDMTASVERRQQQQKKSVLQKSFNCIYP